MWQITVFYISGHDNILFKTFFSVNCYLYFFISVALFSNQYKLVIGFVLCFKFIKRLDNSSGIFSFFKSADR